MSAETGSRSESQTWFGSGLEKIKKSAMTSLDKLNNNIKMCYICDIYYIKIFCSSSSVFTNRPGFFPAFFLLDPKPYPPWGSGSRRPYLNAHSEQGKERRMFSLLLQEKLRQLYHNFGPVFLPVMIGQTNDFSSIRVGWGYRERYNSTDIRDIRTQLFSMWPLFKRLKKFASSNSL